MPKTVKEAMKGKDEVMPIMKTVGDVLKNKPVKSIKLKVKMK